MMGENKKPVSTTTPETNPHRIMFMGMMNVLLVMSDATNEETILRDCDKARDFARTPKTKALRICALTITKEDPHRMAFETVSRITLTRFAKSQVMLSYQTKARFSHSSS